MAAYSCLKQATMASLLITSSMISTSRALQARVAASPSQSFQLASQVWSRTSSTSDRRLEVKRMLTIARRAS